MELIEFIGDWFFYTIVDILIEEAVYVALALAFLAVLLFLTGSEKKKWEK